ncbi:MAG TPA: hypothetical protein VNN13_05825, partial [Methylomirabilota bacterium]|nr:hypothetical protein [Methylomirabilota bacterium]
MFRLGPAAAELFDNVPALGVGDFERGDGEKVGRGVAQGDDEGSIIFRPYADQRRVGDLSLVEFLGVDDVEKDVSVWLCGLGV